MPRILATAFTLCLLCVSCLGCASKRWGFPNGQGTSEVQRARASVHDPYPLNDIGPEVVGGRPREFYQPMPEANRRTNVPIVAPRGY